jgi:hypothetical protein
MGRLFLW